MPSHTSDPDHEPVLSIVIPAFNEEAFLPATLERLSRLTAALDVPCEVVVVDNNSTDRTADAARAAGARVVFEPVNQISRARNAGAKAARGRFLLFLDADSHPPLELVREAVGRLTRNEACGGGAVVLPDKPFPPQVKPLVDSWNRISVKWNLAAGCFVFCRRDAFEAVGGFDLGVFAGEEIWLSRRLKKWGRQHGLPFQVIPDPPVITSARKGEWFSVPQLALQMLLLLAFPLATRSRRLCWMWYRRPPAS